MLRSRRSSTGMAIALSLTTSVISAIVLFAQKSDVVHDVALTTLAAKAFAVVTFVSLTMTPFLVVSAASATALLILVGARSLASDVGFEHAIRIAFLSEGVRNVVWAIRLMVRDVPAAPLTDANDAKWLLTQALQLDHVVWLLAITTLTRWIGRTTISTAAAVGLMAFLARSSWELLRFVLVAP